MKKTKVKLELLTEIDKNFIESSVSGGISTICHKKLFNANNKYMDNHNKDKEDVFIQYLDAKKSYGWAMMQSLPISDFHWSN